ncbi:MAG: hypothetical protein JXL84_15395 [Deltaproteobacteria bacterium]|nr:hypothetical protein [Deltaproteobacteria bacterium]
MIFRRASRATLFCVLSILLATQGWSQELKYREEPISLEEMTEYKAIPFHQESFEKVSNGMTEKDVLSLLGKPLDMKKVQRKGHRWTFHYYYPEGYTVNFRNGLVVGKEKK